MTSIPNVKWAQRADTILLTVEVCDATDVQINITDAFDFSSTDKTGKKFHINIPLFGEVVAEESTNAIKARCVEVKIQKKNTEDEYWPRLTKDKTKIPQLAIDWNKWKDEDEEAAAPEDFGMGGPGGMMGGGGGMGGMGGGGGGMGGMDMASMMAGMGGGGAGGMGGMDMAEMLKNMGGAGGMGGGMGEEGGDSDDEEDVPPPLEKE